MKQIKLSLFFAVAIGALFLFACRDESLNPVPKWETGVHGYGTFTQNAISKKDTLNNFLVANPTQAVTFNHFWESLDKQNTVTKIDFYVYWNENYTDANGNDKVARHGGYVFDDPGKLWKTVTTPAIGHENAKYSITQAEIAALYSAIVPKDATGRTATNPFTKKDNFSIRWVLTAADGRVFERWDPTAICGGIEVAGANCEVKFAVK
jgi:hypothetical protein